LHGTLGATRHSLLHLNLFSSIEPWISERMKEYWAIDGFFRAILKDLFAIRRDMATKDDIRQIREEMANLATRQNYGKSGTT
jgi:hypothetical protein